MVSSPCNNVCELDDDVCTSCGRTLADIANWSSMTEEDRLERMAELRDDDADTDTETEED